ncbi:hypothetical protein EV368DRAFT_68769 [Lentinula lateritia]|nr:hypothetical protein EV368DRAFT_68769 [Lentinula lateritia]
MHLSQLFVYLLLGIVSGAAGAPVSSNMIASSELTKGIAQSANVKSGSDLDLESRAVMEARSKAIDQDRYLVYSDEDDEKIDHPAQAPGHPTKLTAAAHPEPPTTGAKVPEQKPKGPKPKTPLVPLFNLTWVGIETAHLDSERVSVLDELIHRKAFKLVRKAAVSKWKLTNCFINRDNPFIYPAAAQPDSIKTTEFKFLLKLKDDHGAEGEIYCEGRVEGSVVLDVLDTSDSPPTWSHTKTASTLTASNASSARRQGLSPDKLIQGYMFLRAAPRGSKRCKYSGRESRKRLF